MDILLIILAVVAAYLVFITFTYWLARLFFPAIEEKEDELDNLADLKIGVKKLRDKMSYQRERRLYAVKSLGLEKK